MSEQKKTWPEPTAYILPNNNTALLSWVLYELLPKAKEGLPVDLIEPEVLAMDDPATDEYKATTDD